MSYTTTPKLSTLNLFDLTGKNVVISGATRGEFKLTHSYWIPIWLLYLVGIGLACAQALLEAGASICLLIRPGSSIPTHLLENFPNANTNTDTDINTHKEYRYQNISSYPCDLTRIKSKDAEEVIKGAEKALGGPIDILVNCGGIQRRSKAEIFPEDDWNDVRPPSLLTTHYSLYNYHNRIESINHTYRSSKPTSPQHSSSPKHQHDVCSPATPER